MVVEQKVKEAELTEQNSLLLTKDLLRFAMFNISYTRGLFPEKYFSDKSVPALEMKIKKLMPVDADSRKLIDGMEKGVYDALQKKYLRTLLFCICETIKGPMIEEYSFSFSYPNPDSQEVSMNFNRMGSTKKGGALKRHSTTEVTPTQMKFPACKMVRTLDQLMRTLDKLPEERTVLMKLLYYDDVTPADYEPPFFRSCTAEETHNQWSKNPLEMDVGNVNSKHVVLDVKVKSVLDPCDGDSDSNQENEVSLGANTDTEYNIAPAGLPFASTGIYTTSKMPKPQFDKPRTVKVIQETTELSMTMTSKGKMKILRSHRRPRRAAATATGGAVADGADVGASGVDGELRESSSWIRRAVEGVGSFISGIFR